MALTEWHSGPNGGVRWRLVPAGVEVEGTGVERTKGPPKTATWVWEHWAEPINRMARTYRVPCVLIVATICIESRGKEDAFRQEPGYVSDEKTPHKVSVGLMQTLIKTARDTLQMSVDRTWLLHGSNSIHAGTAYVAQQSSATGLDPPLVGAAYNAGDLFPEGGAQNRWKLRQWPKETGQYLDHFVPFFNDAVAVLDRHAVRPAVSFDSLLGTQVASCIRTAAANGDADSKAFKIEFGPQARPQVVSEYTRGVLRDIMRAAGADRVVITSTSRTVEEQAQVMYGNLERHGVDSQLRLYGKSGREVIHEYVRSKQAGNKPALIIDDMVHKIKEVGPTNVSHHIADPAILGVFDVAPSSVSKQGAFEAAVTADRRVSKFLKPNQDPAYHLEVPQPKAP